MSQKRVDSWKNAERYYCACCNVWMGSDRQSILLHENGKKHRENMEASLVKRREEKLEEEKEVKEMDKIKKMMEAAAAGASAADVASGSFACTHTHTQASNTSLYIGTATSGISQSQNKQTLGGGGGQGELNSWQHRKDKRKKSKSGGDDTEKDERANRSSKKRKIELKPNEGHYHYQPKGQDQGQRQDVITTCTYLEGGVYASIMEEDMPVQIWTGSSTMTLEYMKSDSDEVRNMWKDGIILHVHKKLDVNAISNGDDNDYDDDDDDDEIIECDVSYLKDLNDDDETIEKKVIANRLRLILGADDLIPSTIEEARLSLMGGEEVITIENGMEAEIDENTGLTGWGTVSVRKVTVSQEVKEERARARAKRREQLEKEKSKERDLEARKLEELKHSNVEDSALGAYDIWSTTSGTAGYKGVQIHSDAKVDVSDTVKSLAKGKTDVKFKKSGGSKSMFKRAKKKQNRRKTFADDDD